MFRRSHAVARRSVCSGSNRLAHSIEGLEQRTLLSVAAGDLDPSFSGDGKLVVPSADYLRSLDVSAIQSDGKLVVAGGAGAYRQSGGGDAFVARYNLDGSPDMSFGNSPDGRVVINLPG